MNISNFKKGDAIVRVEPAKSLVLKTGGLDEVMSNDIDLANTEKEFDKSYIGEKLIFVGVANGNIYCLLTNEMMKMMLGEDYLVSLPLIDFDEGWESWVDPKTLLEGMNIEKVTNNEFPFPKVDIKFIQLDEDEMNNISDLINKRSGTNQISYDNPFMKLDEKATEKNLQKQYDEAIKNENYELAEELKKKMNKNK